MKRLSITPRPDWRQRVESVGMLYHTIEGETYWDESACYQFTRSEIDALDLATAELHSLCLDAVEEVIRRDLFSRLCIPTECASLVIGSWEMDEPSIYGRFDLCWDGSGQPKLLEYNADTPTSLLEASVVQWFWLRDTQPGADQFNSIRFLANSGMRLMEPAWKMVLSNKGILPLLWELNEGHPNLLPAAFGDQGLDGDHVRKPLFSREGENVAIHRGGSVVETKGSYGGEGYILQQYAPLPAFDGNYPVIGSWVIDHEPAGIGIREDRSEITTNGSRFIPHYFVEG